MMNRRTAIAYVDFLTVLLAWFLLHPQKPHPAEGNIVQKAEFVAILEWPENSTSDVDLWVRNPLGDVANFKHEDIGLITLDHDDVGISRDTVMGPDGKPIEAPIRREMASVRAIMPGRHIVNVMLYALRGTSPVAASVQIIKLNPYQVIVERQIDLSSKGEEQTVASFDVAADGSVSGIDTTDQVSLAKVIQ